MTSTKKQYGQFFTTNFHKLINGFNIDNITNIIEPFYGNGDMIKLFECKHFNIEKYDIFPTMDFVIKQDTLLNPPMYTNKTVITNPPFLAQNKSIDKTIFEMYKQNDLYKCFLVTLLNDTPNSGILILPINFILSQQKSDIRLRRQFFNVFNIDRINVFEHNVFDDTTISVICFQFFKKYKNETKTILNLTDTQTFTFDFALFDYIGYDILYDINPKTYKISRYTSENIENSTNILINCIDIGIVKINAMYTENKFMDTTKNLSERAKITLCIFPNISEEKQIQLVNKFNTILNENRDKYHSLFLPTFREFNRKRISFELIYSFFHFLLN